MKQIVTCLGTTREFSSEIGRQPLRKYDHGKFRLLGTSQESPSQIIYQRQLFFRNGNNDKGNGADSFHAMLA
ncbi:hypothetical protein KGA65_19960 [Ideonella sp. B7]|uniref:hypothetical protein n=1 Tax=Ideonella benzenivorans TaxID=2831643 RepID=UPI001CEC899D|nr:hypothetical protein [Ideonella benzenivorans]MCA6218825.1 hypothetical protein [Ideonella benzenivorans]